MDYALPIRVRWRVDFRGRAGRTKRIARQIRDVSPLFVELRIEGERGLADLTAIVTEVHKCNPRIAITLGLLPGAATALRWGYPVDLTWDAGTNAAFGPLLPEEARAVSFTPDEETIFLLPDVLREFGDCAAAELHLSNVDAVRSLADRGHVPIPRRDQIREAGKAIAASGFSFPGKRIVVHDYFLWRALRDAFPGEVGSRVEFSGCQAASALAHVDWEGNVYPCDSLPIRLGNVTETSFERIWRSPARERLLVSIRSAPAYCESCGELSGCLSGCRGLAYLATGEFDRPDPGCPHGAPADPPEGDAPPRHQDG